MIVKNRLAVLMAENEVRSVSELQRMIQSKGMKISRRTLDKFYSNESSRIDFDTIATICTIFDCSVGELLYLDDASPR